MERSVLEQSETFGSEMFWELVGMSAGEFALASIELFVAIAALTLIAVASLRLLRVTNLAGAGYILASLVGYIIGAVASISYSLLVEEENALVKACASLYFTACLAIGAYGFFSLSKAIKGLNANKSFKADA
jgi:hypothetical protein